MEKNKMKEKAKEKEDTEKLFKDIEENEHIKNADAEIKETDVNVKEIKVEETPVIPEIEELPEEHKKRGRKKKEIKEPEITIIDYKPILNIGISTINIYIKEDSKKITEEEKNILCEMWNNTLQNYTDKIKDSKQLSLISSIIITGLIILPKISKTKNDIDNR